MSDDSDGHLIAEILDAARRVETYIAAEGQDGFMRQDLVYDGVCMNLLRVGECARFLSDQTKALMPTIPWPDLVNLRNRVAHSYETLRPAVLWLIASRSLPELGEALARLKESD